MQIRYNSRLGRRLSNGLLPAVWLVILSCDGLAASPELPPQLTKTATRQAFSLPIPDMKGRWPNNIVYYSLDNASPSAQQAFLRAASKITQHSRARFVERPHDKTDYIYLTSRKTLFACHRMVHASGPQRLSLGAFCQDEETALGLLLEALGVYIPDISSREPGKLTDSDIKVLNELFPNRPTPNLTSTLTNNGLHAIVAPRYQTIRPDNKPRSIYFSLPAHTVASSVSGKIYNFSGDYNLGGEPTDVELLTDLQIRQDTENPKYYIASFRPIRKGRAEIHLYFQNSTGQTGMALSDVSITENNEDFLNQLVNPHTRQCLTAWQPSATPASKETTPPAKLKMQACQEDLLSQSWRLRVNGKLSADNGLCLHHDNFNQLKLVACTLAPTQAWSQEDGRILARAAHQYLTVDKQHPAKLSLQEALPKQDTLRQQWF